MSSNSMKSGLTYLKSGLTWRSLLALIYITVAFQPGFAYLTLMRGGVIGLAAVQWATIILFIEICRLSGKPLTRQEAIVIYLTTRGATLYEWVLAPPLDLTVKPGWIYQIYFKHSPAAIAFGLADKVPWFYSPRSDIVWLSRTFFDPDMLPLLLNTLVWGTTSIICDVLLSLLMHRMYVEVEKLPFPLVIPVVDATDTLLERDWKRLGVLALVTLISSIYSFVLYGLPLISQIVLGLSIRLIPVPWVDLSEYTQIVMPGSGLGIPTDIVAFATGLIIPPKAALGMFIGSIATYVFGNYILVSQGISGYAQEYSYGMALQSVWQRSFLHVWAMPMVGFGIALGIAPLITHRDLLIKIFGGFKTFKEAAGISLRFVLIPYVAATSVVTLLGWWYAPDIPILYLIFLNTLWPLMRFIMTVRGEGYGVSFDVPYARELTFKASGYTGINAWFVPIFQGGSIVSDFKICDMMNTTKKSLIFARFIMYPIGMIFAILIMQSFWSLAPIPSALYPGTQYTWPVLANFQSLFISPKGEQFFGIQPILYTSIVGVILYIIGDRLGYAATIIGLAGGLSSAPAYPIGTFMGSLVGLFLQHRMGREWFTSYRGIIVAGVSLGTGLTVCIATGLTIIQNSIWGWPY